MNEPLNELYCVRQRWFIFGLGWNAGIAPSMLHHWGNGLKDSHSLPPIVCPASSSRPAGVSSVGCTQHESCSWIQPCTAEQRAWFKIAPVPSLIWKRSQEVMANICFLLSPIRSRAITHPHHYHIPCQLNATSWTHSLGLRNTHLSHT